MEVTVEGKKIKFIGVEVRDENRFSSDFKPSYEANIRIKTGRTYVTVENVPVGIVYQSGESERAAILIAMRQLQEVVEFMSAHLADTAKGEASNV